MKECIGYRAEIAAHEIGNAARKDHSESIVFDAPSHDIARLWPCVLTPVEHSHRRRALAAGLVGAKQDRRGPVAKNRGSYDVLFAVVGRPEREPAEFNAKKED